jgi:hypothetical protein
MHRSSMNYVTELTQALRDFSIHDDDRQAVLKSLRSLADKGDGSARAALDSISSTSLPGDLGNLSFATVFEHCCKAGWGEGEFELWARWRTIPRNVLGGLDTEAPAGPLPSWCVEQKVLYDHCKAKNMPVAECHVFLNKLGEHPTYYNRLAYDAGNCEREGGAIPNYRWFLLKLVWDAEHLPEYDWPSRELLQSTLDKFLPIAELTVPLFKEVAALEHELLTTFDHRNEFLAAMKNRPRVRELASYFTSRPDTKVYLPDSVHDLFWQMTKQAS